MRQKLTMEVQDCQARPGGEGWRSELRALETEARCEHYISCRYGIGRIQRKRRHVECFSQWSWQASTSRYQNRHARFSSRVFEHVLLVCSEFYKKLKNVSCEYDRVNGWNSTLQAAWYIRHLHKLSFARVLCFILVKDIDRWLSWMLPGSTGRFSIAILCTDTIQV